nr:hypothetical protein [Tanacetum cinerariifolium]
MFSRCLTTRVTGFDQPPLQIMHMLYCFVNNVHVDYADLLQEGLHYSLEHPSTLISYTRFTKIIISHYMTAYPKISRRVRDKYHNLEHDEMVKSIFYSGKNKAEVGMKIPSWMITIKIKLTDNNQMYAVVFGPSKIKKKLKEHLMAEEIKKLVEGTENIGNDKVDNSISNCQMIMALEEDKSEEDDYELRRRPSAICSRDQDDPQDYAHPEGENSAKRQKPSEHGTYVFVESSSGQDNESEPGPSMSGNQEQLDDFDFWTDSYATDDDELPTEKVSQELVEEMSQIVDEAKLRKVVDKC